MTWSFSHVALWGLWTHSHVKSRDKLKTSPLSQYLRSPNLSGWWQATRSPHIVIWPFNHVVLWGHKTNEIYCISICRRPMTYELPWEAPTLKVIWSTLGHAINSKNYISTSKSFIATKHGSALTSRRMVRMQMPKSSLTSCYLSKCQEFPSEYYYPSLNELLTQCWFQRT